MASKTEVEIVNRVKANICELLRHNNSEINTFLFDFDDGKFDDTDNDMLINKMITIIRLTNETASRCTFDSINFLDCIKGEY